MQVVLPEGSSAITAFPPMGNVSESRETKYTYLDVFGRPVLVLRASNVVALTDDVILINYRWGGLQQPSKGSGVPCEMPG